MNHQHEPNKTQQTKRKPLAEYTPEEQRIIELLEWSRGRKLTAAEIHLSLEQARHIGEL